MIVRDATRDDYTDILEMGRSFARAAGQPELIDDAAIQVLDSLPILKVAENGSIVGMASAMVYPHYWNPDVMVAQELWWWVKEDARGTRAGLMLLDELEKAAKECGASKLMMLCLDDLDGDRVGQIYLRRGYKPQERTFTKAFS